MEYETSILLRLIASTSQDFTHTHFIHPHAFYPPTQGFFIHTSTHTLLRCLGALWDQPGPHKRSKVPPSLENGTTEDFLGSNEYGEGGIRTHEGVTPTRFRVVRDQPDSATSPHALRRSRSLMADEPGTCSMLQKPTALGCGRLKPQPGSGDQLPGF